MANYTFTTSVSYSLATHEVSFTKEKITVKLSSTGATVHSSDYTNGVAFMCRKNDFCIGTLNDNGVFTKNVDYNQPNAKMWLVEKSLKNHFIGSDNESDPGVSNKYNLNKCPVRLTEHPTLSDVVVVECPCESASGPCGNACYTYGT